MAEALGETFCMCERERGSIEAAWSRGSRTATGDASGAKGGGAAIGANLGVEVEMKADSAVKEGQVLKEKVGVVTKERDELRLLAEVKKVMYTASSRSAIIK